MIKGTRNFIVGFEVVEILSDKVIIRHFYEIDGDRVTDRDTYTLIKSDKIEYSYRKDVVASSNLIEGIDFTDTISLDQREWVSKKRETKWE